jgi:hypothetical protein
MPRSSYEPHRTQGQAPGAECLLRVPLPIGDHGRRGPIGSISCGGFIRYKALLTGDTTW